MLNMDESAKTNRAVTVVKYIAAFLLPVLIIFGARLLVYDLYYIPSGSMESTLMTGDKVVGLRLGASNVTPGDIVVFKDDQGWGDSKMLLIKRAIAVSGDTIYSDGAHVFVNGEVIQEPYIQGSTAPFPEQVVPEGEMFVMGDNREHSADSRAHILEEKQFVSFSSIQAKYLFNFPF